MTHVKKVWQDLAQTISNPQPDNLSKTPLLVAHVYLFTADSPVPTTVPGA